MGITPGVTWHRFPLLFLPDFLANKFSLRKCLFVSFAVTTPTSTPAGLKTGATKRYYIGLRRCQT